MPVPLGVLPVLLTWLTVHFTLIQLSLPNALLTPASLTS